MLTSVDAERFEQGFATFVSDFTPTRAELQRLTSSRHSVIPKRTIEPPRQSWVPCQSLNCCTSCIARSTHLCSMIDLKRGLTLRVKVSVPLYLVKLAHDHLVDGANVSVSSHSKRGAVEHTS